MPNPKLAVVVSAGQSRNPEKRELERSIAEEAAKIPGVQAVTLQHLYDLAPKGDSFQSLQSIDHDLVVCSWLYDRAAHWILDRNGVRGQVGEVELRAEDEDEEEEQAEEATDPRVVDSQPRPSRTIYCIDLRVSSNPQDYVDEIKRILNLPPEEANEQISDEAHARFEKPTNDTYVGADAQPTLLGAGATTEITAIEEHPSRRWYPVIDFSRCTNCMECIDFCLFGVYGVDGLETIVVEQADNCRKGCPACSRVCPQNAIIFPQHKTPAIAGAPVDTGGLKIDLSKLFGAPESDENALDIAARERDEQLVLAGRNAVGMNEEIKDRLAKKQGKTDELDSLIDQLDSLDL